jgi:hypothetical protein
MQWAPPTTAPWASRAKIYPGVIRRPSSSPGTTGTRAWPAGPWIYPLPRGHRRQRQRRPGRGADTVSDIDDLSKTDIADHTLETLATRNISEVVVLGRRGPAQAAYTVSEMLSLTQIPATEVVAFPG